MKHILLSGYYGFDNAGDEAVLAGLIAGINNCSDPLDLKLKVLSIAPGHTFAVQRVAAAHRYKNFFRPIVNCDLLLSGGGSLLQDVTSAHGIFYYLAIVRLAQILGRKTMFVAQGIGPLTHKRSQKLTAGVANRLDAITVRDQESADLLRQIGVHKPVTVTADPALLLQTEPTADRSGIRLSMRPWHRVSSDYNSKIIEALTHSLVPSNIQPLNMYGSGDHKAALVVLDALARRDLTKVDRAEHDNFRQLLQKVSASELVIGMRLHALIFAAAAGVPSVALSYDPKVDAFMAQSGQGDAVFSLKNGSTDDLLRVLDAVWTTREQRREQLQAKIPELRKSAQANCDIAVTLLK